MLEARPLLAKGSIPVVPDIPAAVGRSPESAAAWAADRAREIDDLVARNGVVLIRGFEIATPSSFRAVCRAVRPDLRKYRGGDSPRTELDDGVYTSTEYAPSLEVLLHNELSYAGWSPDRVFFGCILPAGKGGETPVADGRKIYQNLDPAVRGRFEERGVIYLQHLWDADGEPGIGKSWQETFESRNRAAVERYLDDAGMEYEWTALGLRTRARHPAVRTHAVTGEKCWHNQADQWHRDMDSVKVSFGATGDPRFAPETSGEESLGNHVVYGDGGEIDTADLHAVRAASRACEVAFAWQAGDVMIIDNVMAMHGRRPFTGPRRVLVAMA